MTKFLKTTPILIASLLLLVGISQADVTGVTFHNVGFDGMRFSASSTNNVVAKYEITADTMGGSLTAFAINNYYQTPAAEEGPDIVPNSVKLWYMADGSAFNAGTAVFVDTLPYIGAGSYVWERFPLNHLLINGSMLYVTVDITATPTENAICAFQGYKDESEIRNPGPSYIYFPSTTVEPSSPPLIYLTSYTEPTQVQVSNINFGQSSVSTGQTLDLLEFTLDNIGGGLTGPVYLSGLTITVYDQFGAVIAPDTAFDSIGIRDGVTDTLLSFVSSPPAGATGIFFPLSVSVTALTDKKLKLFGTATTNTTTAVSAFYVDWFSSLNLDAQYLYTLSTVPVNPAGGYSFPMATNVMDVFFTATQVQVYHTPILADNTVVLKGQTDINPVNYTFINPGNSRTSRIDITSLTLTVTNGDGDTITPSAVFSRVAISGGLLYGETTSIPTTGSEVTITLSNSYISVPAYQPVTTTVQVDILPDAGAVDFRLVLSGTAGIAGQDANNLQAVAAFAAYGSDPFPMSSNTVRIASTFNVTCCSLAPITLYPKQRSDMLEITFEHPGPVDMGNLELRGITVTAQDQTTGVNLNNFLSDVYLVKGNSSELAHSVISAFGSEIYLPLTNVTIAPFTSLTMTIEIRLKTAPIQGTLRIGIAGNTDIDAYQPADPTRPVFVAGLWPLLSNAATVGGGEGQLRLSNYPNPFAAGRVVTRIAYFLSESATVTARLYTLTGNRVNSLAEGVFQTPGEQVLLWNGRAATGAAVKNGVYLLRIEAVSVATGEIITQIRKIAVVK
ncbi:hypothetical protein KAR34_00955 [bacterium]|nr:hypothetical protein [bacterium]